MKLTTIILIIFYFICTWSAGKFVRNIYYHPQGKWKDVIPDPFWVFMVIAPLFNVYTTLLYYTGWWKKEEYRKATSFVNFNYKKS